jgi:hypothetical protein
MLGLEITEATFPLVTDRDVTWGPHRLGSGSFNTVFEVGLRNARGGVVTGVFKPLRSTDTGQAAALMGIAEDHPRTASRNLAVQDCARALGFDVIVATHIGLITVPARDGRRLPDPSLGLIMQVAPGAPAGDLSVAVLSRPDVIRAITQLQLLDHVTAQADRHPYNYHVHVDRHDQVTVMGFDNDQCFGASFTHPDDIRQSQSPDHEHLRGTRMPPVVDRDMASALYGLQPARMREILAGHLSAPEIEASVQRLEHVRAHISALERQGRVIQPEQWSQPGVLRLLQPSNSYAARDIRHADAVRTARALESLARW